MKKYLGISLLGHTLLVVIFIFPYFNKPKFLHTKSSNSLPAYFVKSTMPNCNKKQPSALKIPSKIATLQIKSSVLKKQLQLSLLKILHTAVAENLQYPTIAVELHEMGTVQIIFDITPLGDILNPRILKSSGFEQLDQAALAAIRAMSPVMAAKPFLKITKRMAIDIVFNG